jgi:hypothetical protein
MPTARDTLDIGEERFDVEIEFEMYCNICGDGICGSTEYIRRSNNKFNTHCPRCKREKDEADKEILRLESEIEDLKCELRQAQQGQEV